MFALDVAQIRHFRTAKLTHSGAQILGQQADIMLWPDLAQRAEAPQKGLARESRVGAQRNRPRRVNAGANA